MSGAARPLPRPATGFDCAHFKAILASATDYAFVAMDEGLRVTGWSPGAENLMGWAEDEMLGRGAGLIYTPEDRDAGVPAAEERDARARGRVRDERWHLRKDGSRFWAVGELIHLRDAPGGFVKILRDHTDRRHDEERLRESEDHFRQTVELNPQVPWTCDPRGNITSYSRRWLDLTGQAPGEPDGAGWIKVLHPDDVPTAVAAFSACLATGEPVDVDYRVRMAATGEHRWMRARAYPRRDASGRIQRWYGVVEDVHDRKLAEQALRRSEALNRAIAEHAPDALFLLDREGRVTHANPAVTRLLGWEPAELVGRVLHDAAHHHHADGSPYPASDCPLARAHAAGGVLAAHETRFFRKDGGAVDVLCSTAPIRTNGELSGSVQIAHDISDRLRAEEHRRLLMNELNHRVKNTLATVQAMVAQSVRAAASPQEVRRTLEPRLLALAKAHDILSHESWEGADLLDVAAAALDPHRSEGCGRFETRGPPVRLPPRLALALALVLHELATNAAKYGALSAAEGRIDVSWAATPEPGGCRLSLAWRESGGPRVAPPVRKGFGTRLIERSLAGEAEASVRIDYAPAGARCTLDLFLPAPPA